jgi:lysylphosphatidylglycerol synthetase-like protein (DUF2156 family)
VHVKFVIRDTLLWCQTGFINLWLVVANEIFQTNKSTRPMKCHMPQRAAKSLDKSSNSDTQFPFILSGQMLKP